MIQLSSGLGDRLSTDPVQARCVVLHTIPNSATKMDASFIKVLCICVAIFSVSDGQAISAGTNGSLVLHVGAATLTLGGDTLQEAPGLPMLVSGEILLATSSSASQSQSQVCQASWNADHLFIFFFPLL